jgi:hypothetical protein
VDAQIEGGAQSKVEEDGSLMMAEPDCVVKLLQLFTLFL